MSKETLDYCEAFFESFIACLLVTEHNSWLREASGRRVTAVGDTNKKRTVQSSC